VVNSACACKLRRISYDTYHRLTVMCHYEDNYHSHTVTVIIVGMQVCLYCLMGPYVCSVLFYLPYISIYGILFKSNTPKQKYMVAFVSSDIDYFQRKQRCLYDVFACSIRRESIYYLASQATSLSESTVH